MLVESQSENRMDCRDFTVFYLLFDLRALALLRPI